MSELFSRRELAGFALVIGMGVGLFVAEVVPDSDATDAATESELNSLEREIRREMGLEICEAIADRADDETVTGESVPVSTTTTTVIIHPPMPPSCEVIPVGQLDDGLPAGVNQ